MGRLVSWPARLPVLATTLFAALLALSAVAAAQPGATWSPQQEDTPVHDNQSVNPLAQEDAHITDHTQSTPSPTLKSATRELFSLSSLPASRSMPHSRRRETRRPPPKKSRYPPPRALARSPPRRYSPPSTSPGTWPGLIGNFNGGYGRATFYQGGHNGGACGTGPDVPTYFAALSEVLYQRSAGCGACFELQCMGTVSGQNTCTSNKIVVRATDLCPNAGNPLCAAGPHFDLSPAAFGRLAHPGSGLLKIKYTRVSCPRAPTNSIKVRVVQAGRFFLCLSFPDANERVMAVQMQIGSRPGWRAFSDSWGQTFTSGGDLQGQTITLKLTGESRRSIVLTNCLSPRDRVGGRVKSCAGNFP